MTANVKTMLIHSLTDLTTSFSHVHTVTQRALDEVDYRAGHTSKMLPDLKFGWRCGIVEPNRGQIFNVLTGLTSRYSTWVSSCRRVLA